MARHACILSMHDVRSHQKYRYRTVISRSEAPICTNSNVQVFSFPSVQTSKTLHVRCCSLCFAVLVPTWTKTSPARYKQVSLFRLSEAHICQFVQQDPDKTYFTEERTNDKDKNPIGFFPHQHDPLAGQGASTDGGFTIIDKAAIGHDKLLSLIHPSSKDVFKVRKCMCMCVCVYIYIHTHTHSCMHFWWLPFSRLLNIYI